MKTKDDISECARLIHEAQSIAVLTGAGISTNAGVPDFRGPQGLYVTKRYDADKIFDIRHFCKDQTAFYEFVRDFIDLEEKIQPTFAHRFLADLEARGKLKGIVTQNIDTLHQRAGSKNVYEMHGSIWKSFCMDCRREFSYEEMKIRVRNEATPRCPCKGIIKPDIVFFGENVKAYAESAALAQAADLFFVIGSSCVVHPAATIPTLTQGQIVVVNKDVVDLSTSNVVLSVQDDIDSFFAKVAQAMTADK